jgi:hypothetical protein
LPRAYGGGISHDRSHAGIGYGTLALRGVRSTTQAGLNLSFAAIVSGYFRDPERETDREACAFWLAPGMTRARGER